MVYEDAMVLESEAILAWNMWLPCSDSKEASRGREGTHERCKPAVLGTQGRKVLVGYNPIGSRIITARFDAAPFKLTVIHVYAPTSLSSEEDIEAFYSNIDEALSKTDKK